MSKISINSSTGAVSVASDIAGGTYDLAVSMIDTYGQVASSKFTLTVADANLSSLAISAGTLAPVFAAGTTSYTATVDDCILLCNTTGGAITITLPSSSGLSGRVYFIKKTDSMGLFCKKKKFSEVG
jgi:hypothetical protein